MASLTPVTGRRIAAANLLTLLLLAGCRQPTLPLPPSSEDCRGGNQDSVFSVTLASLRAGAANVTCDGRIVKVSGFLYVQASENDTPVLYESREDADQAIRQLSSATGGAHHEKAISVGIAPPEWRFHRHNVVVEGMFHRSIGHAFTAGGIRTRRIVLRPGSESGPGNPLDAERVLPRLALPPESVRYADGTTAEQNDTVVFLGERAVVVSVRSGGVSLEEWDWPSLGVVLETKSFGLVPVPLGTRLFREIVFKHRGK